MIWICPKCEIETGALPDGELLEQIIAKLNYVIDHSAQATQSAKSAECLSLEAMRLTNELNRKMNDPNISSLYQHEPLEIAESPTIDPDKPMVAITFDDGPNPATTPELLDLLKEYNVRCTFFMVGKNAEANPDIVKRICAEGHELGNHSWDHPDLSVMSSQEIIEQLQSTDDAVFKACGHDPVYIRPPFGAMSDTYHDSVDRDSILWTIDTRDWESHDASKIKKVIDTYVSDGSIILLHDIHEDSVKAMKSVIPDLLEKGYQLVTVGDLYKYGRLS